MTNPNENKNTGTDLATPAENSVAINTTAEGLGAMFQTMLAMATTEMTADKMEKVFDLQERMLDRAILAEFNNDRFEALRKMPRISRDGEVAIPNQKVRNYATLENLQKHIKPILFEHNLTLDWRIGRADGMITVEPFLTHKNTYVLTGGMMHTPPDDSGNKGATQRITSAIKLTKRTTMVAFLNIQEDGKDDDGEAEKIKERKEPTAGQQKMLIAAWKAAELGMANLTEYMDNLRENNPKDTEFLSKHLSKDGKPYYGKLVEQANAFDDKKGNDNAS